MAGIQVTLKRNKQYDIENLEDYKVLEGENNATSIKVTFPQEYKDYSKRVEFANVRKEKWVTALYTPEDRTINYAEDFDKLNFNFTLPDAVTIRGELKVQFVAYLPDESETIVPFEMIYLDIDDSVLYLRKESSKNPDLLLQAYEYANLALDTAKEANERSKNAEELTVQAAESAKKAETSAKNAENSAKNAETSATNAQNSATQAQHSASNAQTSASNAETSAKNAEKSASEASKQATEANNNSKNAVNTSNNADEKATKALEIVDQLTVSSKEIDCEGHVSVQIQTDSSTKHKNIDFSIPAPKKGTSFRAKGVWEATTQYINDQYYIDTVSRHGCTYYCKKTNTNQEPLASEESEYWGLLAIKGSDGGYTIVDDLNSDHADYVLSANQGRVLKELIASSIKTAVDGLIDGSPDSLNTLKELAASINNDPAFNTTIRKVITDEITKIQNGTTVAGQTKAIVANDNRSESVLPSDYFHNNPKRAVYEFKNNSAIGLSYSGLGTNSGVVTLCHWSDKSGGFPVQIATNEAGIFYRVGTAEDAWGAWQRLSTQSEMQSKIDNLQTQINNMLSGKTVFTYLKANVVDLV